MCACWLIHTIFYYEHSEFILLTLLDKLLGIRGTAAELLWVQQTLGSCYLFWSLLPSPGRTEEVQWRISIWYSTASLTSKFNHCIKFEYILNKFNHIKYSLKSINHRNLIPNQATNPSVQHAVIPPQVLNWLMRLSASQRQRRSLKFLWAQRGARTFLEAAALVSKLSSRRPLSCPEGKTATWQVWTTNDWILGGYSRQRQETTRQV